MNTAVLNSYLEELKYAHCSNCLSCSKEINYDKHIDEIKRANKELNVGLTARLIYIECLLHKYQYIDNDVATAIEAINDIRKQLNV